MNALVSLFCSTDNISNFSVASKLFLWSQIDETDKLAKKKDDRILTESLISIFLPD